MFRSIKEVFIGLLSVSVSLIIIDNVSKFTTLCVEITSHA